MEILYQTFILIINIIIQVDSSNLFNGESYVQKYSGDISNQMNKMF